MFFPRQIYFALFRKSTNKTTFIVFTNKKAFVTYSKYLRENEKSKHKKSNEHINKLLCMNFSTSEKNKNNFDFTMKDLEEFLTSFQNGDIELADIPQFYKKFIKDIKLIPRVPEISEDCCGEGCNPCSLDLYNEKAQKRELTIKKLFEKMSDSMNKNIEI